MSPRVFACLMVLGFVPATGCSASFPAPTAVAPIQRLHLQYSAATGDLAVGRTLALKAFSVDADSVWHDVTSAITWFSSDVSVVRPLTSGGVFHAIAPGEARVTGSLDGRSDALTIRVRSGTPLYPYLDVSPLGDPRRPGMISSARALLRQGPVQSVDLTAVAVWSSSDMRVAMVDAGQVVGVAPGTAEITVEHGELVYRYALSIEPPR